MEKCESLHCHEKVQSDVLYCVACQRERADIDVDEAQIAADRATRAYARAVAAAQDALEDLQAALESLRDVRAARAALEVANANG